MAELLHHLIENSAQVSPDREALKFKTDCLSYQALWQSVNLIANGLCHSGLQRQQRVAVYLPKQFETVIAFFATSKAGGIFVPVNPTLKGSQVKHILNDCSATILITSQSRLKSLADSLPECLDLNKVICVDGLSSSTEDLYSQSKFQLLQWDKLNTAQSNHHRVIDSDIVSILYTSGSTGKPKGVVLSHQNMVAGAKSVTKYLKNTEHDRILAVLPFSFDYGFSQLSTAFLSRASVVLMDYLFARDVIKAVATHEITGLAAVPPLWIQLAQLEWPAEAINSLRYITNSGGAMPVSSLQMLRSALPNTQVYLMYGLTEAFRSTYLPPQVLDKHLESMGKAIPNVEVLVVRPDGSECEPDEPGELVHRGPLVAQGYWNDPVKTAERFKPLPNAETGLPLTEIAVWSGDTVRKDKDGFLYFIGRKDEMIKTSGYRVSPSEVEEVLYQTGFVNEAIVVGIAHPQLGQAIVAVATAKTPQGIDLNQLMNACKQRLPAYMLPAKIIILDRLPRNSNGKIDRKLLAEEQQNLFRDPS